VGVKEKAERENKNEREEEYYKQKLRKERLQYFVEKGARET